jgi:hypothetical protein
MSSDNRRISAFALRPSPCARTRRNQTLLGAIAVLSATGLAVSSSFAADPAGTAGRASINHKGSLLFFPHVEVKWDAAGRLRQDTFLTLTNDYPQDVRVQLYLVNGDAPAAAVFAGDPPVLTERAHPGWNWVDVELALTGEEPTYWSAVGGGPKGVSSFMVLDPGAPVGRPDPDLDNLGGRVIRGYVVGWAVNAEGREIRWNHLAGSALVIDYLRAAAWEYNAWAFQAHAGIQGSETRNCLAVNLDNGQCLATGVQPGVIDLDGREYDSVPARLQFQFVAGGDTIFRLPDDSIVVAADTYLTLALIGADLRQDTTGPVTTKAKFDIWNQNEVRFSGTERCITCWDSTLLAFYTGFQAPNHFMARNIQTRSGRARIEGMASSVCDSATVTSRDAPLLGVMQRLLRFPGGGSAKSGQVIGGQGDEAARILYDIIAPPAEARSGGDQ